MTHYVAKRVRFRNGERLSVLQRMDGLPVHEATLFLDGFRTRGCSANTIHYVCATLAIVHRELDAGKIDLIERLEQAQFLTNPELARLATAVQYRATNLNDNEPAGRLAKVVSIRHVHPKLTTPPERVPVDLKTRASRLAYIAQYLEFLSGYVQATLPKSQAKELEAETNRGLKVLRAKIPPVSRRAKLNARVGLSQAEQDRLLEVVHPNSPENPWSAGFVRRRNWLIVVVLLATGMRQGELLGLRISDLSPKSPKVRVLRRPDKIDDPRRQEPNTKTGEREIELSPSIMRVFWQYINIDRYAIKAARRYPQIFVADDGSPLSAASISKLFQKVRKVMPGLPVALTSHVMRHTWNERFSEQADALGISPEAEQRARNEQQGWSSDSRMAEAYTRRHTAKKGRELTLLLQEQLDEKLNRDT